MKIALVAHLRYPIKQPFPGGLEMHTHLLTRALRMRGHSVTLYCARGSDPGLDPVEVCDPTDGIESQEVFDATERNAYSAILDSIEKGGFDLIHNNSLHDLPLRLSAHLCVPMVTILHTPPFDPLALGARGSASRFAAVSRTLAAEWQGIVHDARVIGNGIDLRAFEFQPDLPAEEHAIWSGRIVPEKGLHLAIDAARIAGVHLVIAGARHDAKYWRDWIEPRLGPDLTYLGHLTQAELASRLGRARVALVTPRWEEPFGLVVAEALACGTPVAGFRRGALPDILDARSGRLARTDDVADLARAVREAAQLDRNACRQRAEDLFDATIMTDRYEAFYREVLALQPLRAPALPFYDLARGLDAAEV